MNLLAIFILHKEGDTKVKILQNEFNLDSFGWFERRHIKSLLVLSVRTVIERAARDVRQSIQTEQTVNIMIHAYVRSDGLASVVISNTEYPERVAHNLLSRIMENFTEIYPPISWENMAEKSGKMTSLREMFEKYQDPQEVDQLINLQKDLYETRKMLLNVIQKALQRGETIDDLEAQSIDLSSETKQFLKQAKQTNRRCCCTLF